MRPRSAVFHNVGPFHHVELDLASLKGLTAVVGRNGSGKSTLCGLLTTGTLERKVPGRGLAASLATAADAYIETVVDYGKDTWTIRHEIPQGETGESEVRDADGRQALQSRKVSVYDAWAGKNLPASEVLGASIFVAQKSKGFLAMTEGERAKVLLQAIGAHKLDAQAAIARRRSEDALTETKTLRARIDDIRGSDPMAEAKALESLRIEFAIGTSSVSRARAARDGIASDAERAREALAAYEEARRTRARLDRDIQSLDRSRLDLDQRASGVRSILDRKADIEAAKAKSDALGEEIAQVDSELRALEADVAEHKSIVDLHTQRAADASRASRAARERASRAREQLRDEENVRAAATGLDALRTLHAEAERKEAEAMQVRRELDAKHLASADERVANLRATLSEIRDTGTDASMGAVVDLASMTLETDDAAIHAIADAPRAKRAAEEVLASARAEALRLGKSVAISERVAALLPAIEAAKADLARAEAESHAADREARESAMTADASTAGMRKARELVGAADRKRTDLRIARMGLAADVALVPAVAEAGARLAEIEPQRVAAIETLSRMRAELAAVPDLQAPAPPPDLGLAEASLKAAERVVAETEKAIALAEKDLSDAKVAETKRLDLEAKLTRAMERHVDYKRLAADIDGVKLAEIDAAGPELTAIANDLLHTCVGPEWTAAIETQRADATGKKLLDGVVVRVLYGGDPSQNKPGREGSGESFSPGEQVLPNEAVSLALAALACRRLGIKRPLLIRDETGSALDPTNARAHIRMLRMAMEMIDAQGVLFVSHQREAIDLADQKWVIRGGQVFVTTGPVEEADMPAADSEKEAA